MNERAKSEMAAHVKGVVGPMKDAVLGSAKRDLVTLSQEDQDKIAEQFGAAIAQAQEMGPPVAFLVLGLHRDQKGDRPVGSFGAGGDVETLLLASSYLHATCKAQALDNNVCVCPACLMRLTMQARAHLTGREVDEDETAVSSIDRLLARILGGERG